MRVPLSGDVIQSLLPWNSLNGTQFGLVNISPGKSAAPDLQHAMLKEAGSHGRQSGRFGEALVVLAAHFDPRRPPAPPEEKALFDLRRMLADIADVKERHEGSR